MSSDPPAVDAPAFLAGMADTVGRMRALCAAIVEAPARHGHQPSAQSVAMSDIAKESQYAKRCGEDWLAPVGDTHTFGAMTLLAASDYGRCYADLFAGDRAPVYGHLVLARAGLEACVISAWLNNPRIGVEERVKRGLCELVYSAWEMVRLKIDDKGKAADLVARHERNASALGWDLKRDREKPAIDGTKRPSIPTGIAEMTTGDSAKDLGRVQWNYLSSVMHVTWWGLGQGVVEPPTAPVGLSPSTAMVGTQSKAVNGQSLCLLRAIRQAGTARLTLMGWLDDAWAEAERASMVHENALLKWIASAQ